MKKSLPVIKTPDDRAKYLEAYEAVFSLWNVPHDSIEVETRYGLTHINASGPDDGYPLVLLHGAGLSSNVWFANISELSSRYRVYAVDVIGDAGKSVARCLMKKTVNYADWLKEIFDQLDIEKGYIVGHSYGGWLALNMALSYPERLSKIVLLAPAASLLPLSPITKLILYLAEYKIYPPARSVLRVAAAPETKLKEPFIHHMEMVNQYCSPVTMFPTVFTDTELKRLNLPTLLLIGSREKIYNPNKAIERARRLMPKLTAKIIPDAGHLLIMDQPETINSNIQEFLSAD
jgi:pimeloyl-ACP methyl ester carboxylesterase